MPEDRNFILCKYHVHFKGLGSDFHGIRKKTCITRLFKDVRDDIETMRLESDSDRLVRSCFSGDTVSREE